MQDRLNKLLSVKSIVTIVLTALKQGTKFRCCGYYTKAGDRVWLYGTANGHTGFCVRDYLA